jgi:predicted site-specific integrase-resolvase
VLSIEEAMEVAHVSFSTLYRWMKMEAIEWAYNQRGERRIYQDSLLRVPAVLQKKTDSVCELVAGEEPA